MSNLLSISSWFAKPHPVVVKNRKFFHNFDETAKLADYDFVVFDTELTGLNRSRDEIISIGAVRIRNLQIDLGETFNETIQPQNIDHTDATLIHRITPEQLRGAKPIDKVLPRFIEFLGNSVLIGHYVGLDMGFMNRATKSIFGKKFANPAVDTMIMAYKYKKAILEEFDEELATCSSCNLNDLSREFNLPPYNAHDGFEDALQTAYLFLFLVKKYKVSTLFKSGHMQTLKDLFKVCRVKTLRL